MIDISLVKLYLRDIHEVFVLEDMLAPVEIQGGKVLTTECFHVNLDKDEKYLANDIAKYFNSYKDKERFFAFHSIEGCKLRFGSINLELNKNYDFIRPPFNPPILQSVKRDFSFEIAEGIPAGDLINAIIGCDNNIVKAYVFDRFVGQGVPEGKVRLAIEVTFQPTEKSYTNDELKIISEKIIDVIKNIKKKNVGEALK